MRPLYKPVAHAVNIFITFLLTYLLLRPQHPIFTIFQSFKREKTCIRPLRGNCALPVCLLVYVTGFCCVHDKQEVQPVKSAPRCAIQMKSIDLPKQGSASFTYIVTHDKTSDPSPWLGGLPFTRLKRKLFPSIMARKHPSPTYSTA